MDGEAEGLQAFRKKLAELQKVGDPIEARAEVRALGGASTQQHRRAATSPAAGARASGRRDCSDRGLHRCGWRRMLRWSCRCGRCRTRRCERVVCVACRRRSSVPRPCRRRARTPSSSWRRWACGPTRGPGSRRRRGTRSRQRCALALNGTRPTLFSSLEFDLRREGCAHAGRGRGGARTCRSERVWDGAPCVRAQIKAYLAWLEGKEEAQSKKQPHEEPAFLVKDVSGHAPSLPPSRPCWLVRG